MFQRRLPLSTHDETTALLARTPSDRMLGDFWVSAAIYNAMRDRARTRELKDCMGHTAITHRIFIDER
jgi:hypothetical protein